jgi:hypothetical protein
MVCLWRRRTLWLPGASYTRILGTKFEVDTGDAGPVTSHPYKKWPEENSKTKHHISKGIAMGTLVPHVGQWSTPAFIVKDHNKPMGRLVCDYRRVNTITRRHYALTPRLDQLLRSTSGHYFFSRVDAVIGLNHLELTGTAAERLAICTPSGLHRWVVMPYGPVDALQACQTVMRRTFDRIADLEIHMDDLCKYT